MTTNNFLYAQLQPFALSGSGAIAGATSITLQSMTDIDGNALSMAGAFGTKGFGTLDPGNGTSEEQISFTGLNNNTNGTVTLSGVSTVAFIYPYTESSGLAKTHAGAAPFVISNTAGFYNEVVSKNDDATITGKLTFPGGGNASAPVSGTVYAIPTDDLEYASKKYVDSVAIAGAPNANTTTKGIVQLPTQAQMDAGTSTGSTGASLTPTPANIRSKLLSDGVADTGVADAYVITPSPVITAYASYQSFSFVAAHTNTTTSTLAVNGLTTKTIKKQDGATNLAAGDIVAGQLVTVEYDGTNFQMLNPVANAPATQTFVTGKLKFGGTGADGALAIASGTTTIDCANAAVVVKNYTSISITGTGTLGFSNPHANGTIIILKSQGAVTLTSSSTPMIDASGMGAAGGVAGTTGAASGQTGSSGNAFYIFVSKGGGGGQTGPTGGTGGATPTAIAPASFFSAATQTILKYGSQLWVGSGGGGGGANNASNNATQGTGGRGGGGLIIECAGAWNFTTASGISVAGKIGTNPTNTTYGGAGGGGSGGFLLALYTTLTASSGTVAVTGGLGGANGSDSGSAGGGGGGTPYTAGSNGSTGTGTNTGTGASGNSLITANTDWD